MFGQQYDRVWQIISTKVNSKIKYHTIAGQSQYWMKAQLPANRYNQRNKID